MRADELYARGMTRLLEAGVPEPDWDAWYLFSEVTGWDRAYYCAHTDEEIEAGQAEQYEGYVNRRGMRIPLHRVLGEREFMGFPMYLTEDTLVPRLDTECVVEEALEVLKHMERRPLRVLDVCTGTGCIAIALAGLYGSNEQKDLIVTATDLNPGALETAARNAERNEVDITFLQGDLLKAASGTGRYDVIVSNPPYIPALVIETLDPEVRDHDPRMALDGGRDGLDFYRRLIPEALDYLESGGSLVLEIGDDQGAAVTKLMKQAGYKNVTLKQDLAGNDRIVIGGKNV